LIKLGIKVDPARLLIRRADAARDALRYRDAATLYAEALRLSPHLGGIHIQAGHMFKEAGELDLAGHHYQEAIRLLPNDPEAALQLGHFYKRAGRIGDAVRAYERAAELAPDSAAQLELDALRAAGLGEPVAPGASTAPDLDALRQEGEPTGLKLASLYGVLAPENLPKPFDALLHHSADSVSLRHFGVELNTYWGLRPVLRGVEAIRGFAISSTPITTVEARVNGLPIHRGPLKGPYELQFALNPEGVRKYVFNIWYDFSGFAPGLYELDLSFESAVGPVSSLLQTFVVEAPLLEADHPGSDALINIDPDGVGSVEDRINARPSIVHDAQRPNRLPSIRNVLVLRPDQLGDLVASIPAVLRLRELLPEARIAGLFSPANADLARTLGLFDEIIVRDFSESFYQRTRTVTLAEQIELRDQLAPYAFDLAIDLSQSRMSRPLLALTGAAFTLGFEDPDWPRLSASIGDACLDPKNGKEVGSHSARILSLADSVARLMKGHARVIRRDDLSREQLAPYGIAAGDRFAVLHTGARIVFSRWPHYLALAERLHAETDLKIVLFTGDPELANSLPPPLADSDRVVILDRQLPFDDFDAMLSFCDVYVGNDSGPKHLAALRGVPVVSIHSARISWSEWGQEQSGVVITRKVPCAGCALYHDVDECGKDYVCINGISLDEVYGAVRRYV
jgi:ADP-heptose:LPS heptosyltransferase